jgi:hypothetical protein
MARCVVSLTGPKATILNYDGLPQTKISNTGDSLPKAMRMPRSVAELALIPSARNVQWNLTRKPQLDEYVFNHSNNRSDQHDPIHHCWNGPTVSYFLAHSLSSCKCPKLLADSGLKWNRNLFGSRALTWQSRNHPSLRRDLLAMNY